MKSEQTKYRTARDMVKLTREQAAFELHIGVTSLKDYELGKRQPPREVEVAMSKLYQAPWVMDPMIGHDFRPKRLAEAFVLYQKELQDVELMRARAVEIVADGVVDEDEVPDMIRFQQELRELRAAALEFEYASAQ